MPSSKNKFSNYLSEETKENFIVANMTPIIINKALNKLKNKISSGPDKISSNLLKSINYASYHESYMFVDHKVV